MEWYNLDVDEALSLALSNPVYIASAFMYLRLSYGLMMEFINYNEFKKMG